ncbi:hypothetical protein L1987_07789 [Smallanthus sonchifolius]|uniref:Uncharacterized protein n=1 Tax=Smallanthus sonchifolius TaxID=185202 RepID=A0ACB9JIX5_9ASTR|nr:hypothetical protein L1987_07789 [Smallanthus sonchifolius]
MSVAKTTTSVPTCLPTKATEIDSILWHRKLGHISYRKMNYLVRNGLITGVPRLRFFVTDDCMPCKKGKQQRKYHKPKIQNSIDTPLELLHMDLLGPISIKSIGGKSYCLVVTDDYSRISWVHFLGTKDETAGILQYLILSLENICKLKVRRIRSDNGTEFKNNVMELFSLKKGIHHEVSAPYTPQQNGVAERKNRTLIETARTMLLDAKLPITFWAEAVNTACHVLNRVLVVKRHNKTCYELINNRPPNLDCLIPFGSPCSLLLQSKERKSKFHTKATEGIFLGYVANSPCKRVYNKETRSVEEWFESFNIPDLSAEDAARLYEHYSSGNHSTFLTRSTIPIPTTDPNASSASGTHETDTEKDTNIEGNDAPADPNNLEGDKAQVDPINIESSTGTHNVEEVSTNLDSVIQEQAVPETRVHRNHPVDNIIGDPDAGVQTQSRTITENTSLYAEILDTGVMEKCLHIAFVSQMEPKNVKDAFIDNCCIEAMQDELSQFRKLHVWDLVDFPKGEHPIGTRRVFKCKTDDRHDVVRNKARLVVQGFYQQKGLDYTKVYAPVARIEAIRLFLAYASYVGFKVYQLDVKSAFLYGKVHEEVYVTQPPGFEDPQFPNKVYKLDKALYGLHQAPRAWYETLSKHLLSNGFDRGQIDLTLFISKAEGDIPLVQPKESHLIDVKRIFRYLKGKPQLGLWYPKHRSFDFKAYIDSDYGGCNLDRKSTSGGCQFLGDRLVSWQCKKQSTVSVSTCEAKYIAVASCCSQILWI